MPDAHSDPFVFPPQLWFGLLCHAVGKDEAGRINLLGIFNRIALAGPPENTGVPSHAHLNGILVVGFSGGLGHFEAQIELRNADSHTLWQRPSGPWAFDLGPGERGGAILAEQVQYWLTQQGQYHYWVRLEPSGGEHQVQFEVHSEIAPTELEQGDSGE